MPTYINLIQTSGGVEFDIDTENGMQGPPGIVGPNDTFHGTYLLPTTPAETMETIKRLLLGLPSSKETPPKILRKQLQKELLKNKAVEVSPLGIITQ